MKCMFGYSNCGRGASCPPNTPAVADCERFLREYSDALILRFSFEEKTPGDRHEWSKQVNQKLWDLERSIFLRGYVKSFVFYIDGCSICNECTSHRENCKYPLASRPTPEAFGIDVFGIARKMRYEINVLRETTEKMNRFASLLIK